MGDDVGSKLSKAYCKDVLGKLLENLNQDISSLRPFPEPSEV